MDFGGANLFDDFTDVGATTPGQIRWNNIARDPNFVGVNGRIDLVVTVSSGSTYTPGGGSSNLQGNGNNGVPDGAARIKLQVETTTVNIPEASSSLLIIFGGSLIVLYRKRNTC